MSTPLIVSCLCEAVRIAVTPPIHKVGICHCVNCRRAQGAGAWTWAMVHQQQVEYVSGADFAERYTSDTGATRTFCRTCGSSLTYESPRWPGCVDLSVANFEAPFAEKPTHHNYSDRAPHWCPIEDDLPRFGGDSGAEPL